MTIPRWDALRQLLGGAASLTGVEASHVMKLGLAMLAPPPPIARPLGGLSGLNYDSSPLQLCLSTSEEGVRGRLLGDPAYVLGDARARYEASLKALEQVLELSRTLPLREVLLRTLQLNLPERPDEPFDYPDGVLWVGAGLGTPGLAMYMDARRGGAPRAIDRLERWLHRITTESAAIPTDISSFMSSLRSHADLMCLGIEGVDPKLSRAKVYWRLKEPRRLEDLGIAGFKHPDFARFLGLCVGERSIRLTGVVLNAGFRLVGGGRSDTKLDVCGCRNCLAFSRQEAVDMIARLTDHWRLAPLPTAQALEVGELAYVGFGLDHKERPRLNVYFKVLPA